MNEYRIERDLSGNLSDMVDEIAERVQWRVDQAALDKAADKLAEFGYVKVVRCRDCKHFMNGDSCNLQDEWNDFHWLQVEPDGFCAWGERRDA